MSAAPQLPELEMVVGLEVHAQLLTRTKLFSPMPTLFGQEPNSQVNEICAGLPGVLPVLNQKALELAIRTGLALGCDIRPVSQFARKNYFYPDLPKGYQISQFELPLCVGGRLAFMVDGTERSCGITRVHVEEDAGKSIHRPGSDVTAVDLNRAGVPLCEIVSEPDLRTPDEAVAYFKELRNVLMVVGVCDGNMEEGSLRCDANVSVRRRGDTELGTKVEIKNLNSFKFLKDALLFEYGRQVACVKSGERIHQETRLWRADTRQSIGMRRKEGSDDYRYFPDPDLPPLVVEPSWIAEIKPTLPELPRDKRRRYQAELSLPAHDATVLTGSRGLAAYFEAAVALHPTNPKGLSNWIMTEVAGRARNDDEISALRLTPSHLASLVKLLDEGAISGPTAKEVLSVVLETGEMPEALVDARGLRLVRDDGLIIEAARRLVAENPKQVEQLKAGKVQVKGFFVGQVMKALGGKADPAAINRILDDLLN